jgi:hypothetical protein
MGTLNTREDFPHECHGDGCAVCLWANARLARLAVQREIAAGFPAYEKEPKRDEFPSDYDAPAVY